MQKVIINISFLKDLYLILNIIIVFINVLLFIQEKEFFIINLRF